MTEENFLNNKNITVFSFGRAPVSIEILKQISGVTFEEVYNNSLLVEIEEIPVKVIQLKDLIRNKIASGRPKDLNDIENLDNDHKK